MNDRFELRLTVEEKLNWEMAAREAGVPLAKWVRGVVNHVLLTNFVAGAEVRIVKSAVTDKVADAVVGLAESTDSGQDQVTDSVTDSSEPELCARCKKMVRILKGFVPDRNCQTCRAMRR